eukprot:s747_g9.t4
MGGKTRRLLLQEAALAATMLLEERSKLKEAVRFLNDRCHALQEELESTREELRASKKVKVGQSLMAGTLGRDREDGHMFPSILSVVNIFQASRVEEFGRQKAKAAIRIQEPSPPTEEARSAGPAVFDISDNDDLKDELERQFAFKDEDIHRNLVEAVEPESGLTKQVEEEQVQAQSAAALKAEAAQVQQLKDKLAAVEEQKLEADREAARVAAEAEAQRKEIQRQREELQRLEAAKDTFLARQKEEEKARVAKEHHDLMESRKAQQQEMQEDLKEHQEALRALERQRECVAAEAEEHRKEIQCQREELQRLEVAVVVRGADDHVVVLLAAAKFLARQKEEDELMRLNEEFKRQKQEKARVAQEHHDLMESRKAQQQEVRRIQEEIPRWHEGAGTRSPPPLKQPVWPVFEKLQDSTMAGGQEIRHAKSTLADPVPHRRC